MIKDLGSYQRHKIALSSGKEDKSELKTIQIFLFHTNEEVLEPIDRENPEARWVDKDKVVELLSHPKDKEFFLKIASEI